MLKWILFVLILLAPLSAFANCPSSAPVSCGDFCCPYGENGSLSVCCEDGTCTSTESCGSITTLTCPSDYPVNCGDGYCCPYTDSGGTNSCCGDGKCTSTGTCSTLSCSGSTPVDCGYGCCPDDNGSTKVCCTDGISCGTNGKCPSNSSGTGGSSSSSGGSSSSSEGGSSSSSKGGSSSSSSSGGSPSSVDTSSTDEVCDITENGNCSSKVCLVDGGEQMDYYVNGQFECSYDGSQDTADCVGDAQDKFIACIKNASNSNDSGDSGGGGCAVTSHGSSSNWLLLAFGLLFGIASFRRHLRA
jgi:hypothetical protein